MKEIEISFEISGICALEIPNTLKDRDEIIEFISERIFSELKINTWYEHNENIEIN